MLLLQPNHFKRLSYTPALYECNAWKQTQVTEVLLTMNPGLIGTVFLRSDAVATIFFSLFILVRLLFKGGVYFVGKPMDSNDS